jgi:hypothetical protein
MSTFKKAKVVMLPTDQKTNIINTNQGLLYNSNDYIGINHHLYIISDDEIKKEDWVINSWKEIHQITKNDGKEYIKTCKKIIATTNNSLTEDRQKAAFVVTGHPLPQPSQQFIQKFVEEYNHGNIITDVLVEYEQKSKGFVNALKGKYNYENIIKVNPKDNTITIKKVKDSWNREEVIKLLRDAHLDIVDGNYSKGLNKWIEENL